MTRAIRGRRCQACVFGWTGPTKFWPTTCGEPCEYGEDRCRYHRRANPDR